MRIASRDFGDVEIDEKDIITFQQPIFGFEHLKQYVFLQNEEISADFVWLQPVDDPEICFILVDPSLVLEDYRPKLVPEMERMLGEGDCMCWLIVTVLEDFTKSTVNLKSPVFVNPATKNAAQIILEQDCPIRFPILKEDGGRA